MAITRGRFPGLMRGIRSPRIRIKRVRRIGVPSMKRVRLSGPRIKIGNPKKRKY